MPKIDQTKLRVAGYEVVEHTKAGDHLGFVVHHLAAPLPGVHETRDDAWEAAQDHAGKA